MFGKKLSIGFGTVRSFRHPQGLGTYPLQIRGDEVFHLSWRRTAWAGMVTHALLERILERFSGKLVNATYPHQLRLHANLLLRDALSFVKTQLESDSSAGSLAALNGLRMERNVSKDLPRVFFLGNVNIHSAENAHFVLCARRCARP